MSDNQETAPQPAARRDMPEKMPQIGEAVTMWVEGRFDVRCQSHNSDGSITVALLPSGHQGVVHEYDSEAWEYRRFPEGRS